MGREVERSESLSTHYIGPHTQPSIYLNLPHTKYAQRESEYTLNSASRPAGGPRGESSRRAELRNELGSCALLRTACAPWRSC